tara:strand:+ start:467 stop:805 length:339 start_codon:yes stop_codon:yes gene_type:complete
MAIQSFEIDINGKVETIEFEDDMPFGKFEAIIMKTANVSNEDNLLDNVQKYRKEIMLNSLKKAPFPITIDGLNEVGYKVITEIGNKVLEAYPLGEYLNQMMSPFNDSLPQKK